MLKKDTIKKLKEWGFDVTKLETAIKDEAEVDFTLPEINNLSDEDLATRDAQVIAAAKPDIIKVAKDSGIEIANKAIAKKFSLTDVDTKDPDKVIAALEATMSKGDAGVKERADLLLADKVRLEAELVAEKGKGQAAMFDAELITSFPAKRAGMTDKQFLLLVKDSLEFGEENGVRVVKKDGHVLRDPKTQAPIAAKDAVNTLFTDNKWIGAEGGKGGRGGNDDLPPTGGIKKYSQFESQWLKDNPDGNLMSNGFNSALQAAIKETTDFNMDA